MKRHVTFFWIAAMVLAMGASLAWAIPALTGRQLSPVVPRSVQFALPSSHWAAQGLAPGIYEATPHTTFVLAPNGVDLRMVYRPDTSGFRTPIYQPPGHLAKR